MPVHQPNNDVGSARDTVFDAADASAPQGNAKAGGAEVAAGQTLASAPTWLPPLNVRDGERQFLAPRHRHSVVMGHGTTSYELRARCPPVRLKTSHYLSFTSNLFSGESILGKYLLAWLFGVPAFVLVLVFIFFR